MYIGKTTCMDFYLTFQEGKAVIYFMIATKIVFCYQFTRLVLKKPLFGGKVHEFQHFWVCYLLLMQQYICFAIIRQNVAGSPELV